MTIKRFMRLSTFILMVAIASTIPVPMTFKRKDDLPKDLIEQVEQVEQVEQNDNEKDTSDIKEIA